jgi:hypothetical protein
MADDNGSGNSGGNTSVFWEVRHGSRTNPQPPSIYTGAGAAPRGSVKVQTVTEGHTNADFTAIGQGEHPGLFKVVLRFRDADWNKVPPAQRAWIDGAATRVGTDRILTVLVPAIRRDMPAAGAQWADMPWEIHWEW